MDNNNWAIYINHTHTHLHTHTCTHTYTHIHIHTNMHIYNTQTHKHIYTLKERQQQSNFWECMRSWEKKTYRQIHTQIHIHNHTHKYTIHIITYRNFEAYKLLTTECNLTVNFFSKLSKNKSGISILYLNSELFFSNY